MDDNTNRKLEKPINNPQSKEEVTEKPEEDNDSAPIIQNLYINNSPPENINNAIKQSKYYELNTIQPENTNSNFPGYPQPYNYPYPGQVPFYPPQGNFYYNNGAQFYNGKQITQPNNGIPQNKKIIICLSVLLIIFFIVDLMFQLIQVLNLFILIDDVAILFMAIIYLFLSIKGKPLNHFMIRYGTIFVWFVGFSLRGFGSFFLRKASISLAYFFLTIVRTFILFLCIPQTFHQ